MVDPGICVYKVGAQPTSEALAPSGGRVKGVFPLPHEIFLLNKR